MKKHLVKNGQKIEGFVFQNNNLEWFYAFGKPSQNDYIAFKCNSLQAGIDNIQEGLSITEIEQFNNVI